MALVTLPVTKDVLNYRFTTALDKIVYIIEIRFNSRLNRWVMSLLDSNETPLISNKLIMINGFPLQNFKSDSIPKGILLFLNIKNLNVEADKDTFAIDVLMNYIEAV